MKRTRLQSGPGPKRTKGLRARSKRKPTRPREFVEPGVVLHADGRHECDLTSAGRTAYQARTDEMVMRQHGRCAICQMPFDRFSELRRPTFEHERPKGNGSAWRDDRITHEDGRWRNAAACVVCQGFKGSRHFEWRKGQYVPVGGH